MKIKTKYGIVNTKDDAVVIVFANDAERIEFASNILSFFKPKEGERKWAITPDGMSEEQGREFMENCDETKDNNRVQLIEKPNGITRMIFTIDCSNSQTTEIARQNLIEFMKNYKL